MKRIPFYYLFGLIFFLLPHLLQAQKIKIISGDDGNPLPYATVTNFNTKSVKSADKYGIINLSGQIGDSIGVSYVGHSTEYFRIGHTDLSIVKLVSVASNLPNVYVKSCQRSKKHISKNYDVKGERISNLLWSGSIDSYYFAVPINSEKQNSFLEEFSFWLNKDVSSPDISLYTPLLFSFYSVSDSSMLPCEALLKSSVVYTPKNYGKQTVQLDSLRIKIPSLGLYVGIQYLMHDDYKWYQTLNLQGNDGNSTRDSLIVRYGVKIATVISEFSEMVYWNPLSNKWIPIGSATNLNMSQKSLRYSIKHEAKIRYCDN